MERSCSSMRTQVQGSTLGGRRLPSFVRPSKVGRISSRIRAQNTFQRGGAEESRREALIGIAGGIAGVGLTFAQTATAADCELQSSPSGLQYCDVKEGTGPEPVKGALIKCHYTGRLASNGAVFDSSYDRGRPLTFKIGVRQVIQGWDMGILGTEGIPPMKAGGKRTLVIPAELGYGDRGAGGVIPPGATLVFDVEYLGGIR